MSNKRTSFRACTLLLLLIRVGNVSAAQGSNEDKLLLAVKSGDVSRVRALLHRGAHITQENGGALLSKAASLGRLPMVRFLIAHGVDVNAFHIQGMAQLDDAGALGAAAEAGQREVVLWLLAHVAKQHAYQTSGPEAMYTPLLVAVASQGRTSIVRTLLSHGYLPNCQETVFITDGNMHYGSTPLTAAIQGGHTSTVALLLAAGVDVNQMLKQDVNGHCTALSVAIGKADADIVALLLKQGANPRLKVDGKTPAEIARAGGHPAITRILEAASSSEKSRK